MRLLVIGLVLSAATFAVRLPVILASDPAFMSSAEAGVAEHSSRLGRLPARTTSARAATSSAGVQTTGRVPLTIGNQTAGSFDDATGHSAQSHLVYAVNSHVWWLFTLTSDADSEGGSNHLVKAFRSSGPDLATATWIAAADSPPAAAGGPNQSMGGGRALGVAYVNNSPVDVIHADISMAFDGQDGRTGHIRAVVTGTSITWSSWNFFDEPAATWTLPRGNTVGVSSGKFIHTGGPILQQEVDANARKSTSADTGSTWASGFSAPAVIDGSMLNQNNAMAFAPLANDVMLAVYDNGQNVESNQTNLRYKRSNAGGAWPGIAVGSQMGGDGNVFSTNAVIDQNDWALVPVSASQVYVFRRKASGSGIDAAFYNVAANAWSAMSPAPPALGAGQSFKAGAGLFGATDGTSVWVCVINTDLANSILCARFDGTAWTPWSIVPGTDIGSQNRNYISGSPQVGNNQIGLIWTEGTSLFDVVAYSFGAAPDVAAPKVSLTAPANGATVSATIPISATATDNVGVIGVQFRLDGLDFGPEVIVPPYTMLWNTAAGANGAHALTAIARDDAGNTATAAAVSVTVANIQTPIITWPVPPKIIVGTALGATQLNATANTPGTFLYTPAAGAVLPGGLGQTLSVLFTPTDLTKFTTATASVTIDVVNVVPNVVGLTQAAATTAIATAGLVVGTVTTASSTTVPSGSVISQTPAAAAQVAVGSAVSLVVSSGPPQVAVPDVVGLTQAAATAAITGAGLKVGALTTAASTTVPSGSVISQTPAAGTQAASGTAVALVVSSGPLKVAVPAVVGLTQAAATTAITNAGLVLGTVTAASSTTVPAGSVISQTPAAATQVASGSAVSLVVSSGVSQVAVPNVVGLTQAAATTAITDAGLIVGTTTTASSATVPSGSVMSQSPAAATQVASGSAVALVVSSGPPKVAVPNVVGLTQAAATTAITSAGLVVGTVTTAASATAPSGSVMTETPAAATQVVSGSAVALVVSSGPPQATVPNVVGLTQTAATDAMLAAGLTLVSTTTATSATVPAGVVISQAPAAGTQVVVTTSVTLVISSGPPQVAVPNVVGLTQAAASASIVNAGLAVGTITIASSATVPSGSVISQTPAAATQLVIGSAVSLLVSSGPPQVAVPSVVGLTQAAASAAIANVGLTVGAVTTAPSAVVPAGSVIDQSPAADTLVAGGTAVTLLVSSGPPAAAALTIDTSISADGVGTLTTPAFSTKAPNEMLVLFASSAGPTSMSSKQMLAISGAGLTWTLVNRVNTQFGSAEIWKAYASAPLANATVTSVQSLVGGFHQSLTVVAFQGAGGTGAIGGASAMFGPTSGSLTTTRAGSLVYGVADDSARAAARTIGANQVMVHQWIDAAAAYTFWVQSLGSPVDASGSSVTIDDTAPTSDRWNLALVEILVGAGKATVPDVVGLTQTAASTAITDAGLTVGAVTTASSTTVPAGIVISQTPAALTQVASGSAVALVVSSGLPQIAVPSVVGLTQGAATTSITNAGLVIGTVTAASSTTVPSGSVISQTPVAGTQVARGSAVALVVSSGPPQIAVPNVIGLTQAGATSTITTAGLTLGGVTTVSSTIVPAGSVISQTPAGGTQVASGSAVALIVSSGAPQVTVPDVVGLTQAAASTAISNAGLTISAVTTELSGTVPAGSVIRQTPAAGSQVASNSAVALVVAATQADVVVVVPNVVGLTQTTATTVITGAGFIVGTLASAQSATVPAGSVISQTPIAGATLPPGGAVNLVISSGVPAGTPQADLTVSVDGNGTITTPGFSIAGAGELLVAFASSDGPSSSTRQTLNISGGGLAWTLVKRANVQFGTAEVWTAMTSGPLVNAAVTATQSSTSFHQSLTVVAFSGAGGIGDAVPGSGRRTLPSVSLITMAPGSLIYGVGVDPEKPTARTVASDETLVHQWVDRGSNKTFWVQAFVAPVADGGSVATVNDTSPSNETWNMVAVEIVAR